MSTLPAEFYERPVLEVAHDLIGCVLAHRGVSGVIVETEAYHQSEPACHAFIGLTPRTSTLFGESGRAYVYRSYGIHAMLNAVCEAPGTGAAVLIRALAPLEGVQAMRARRPRGRTRPRRPGNAASEVRSPPASDDRRLCSGPGKLAQALDIELALNETSLISGPISIAEPYGGTYATAERRILQGPRIGISKAVDLPWRFCAAGDPNVSRPWPPGAQAVSRPR